jgi:hypothetical protein
VVRDIDLVMSAVDTTSTTANTGTYLPVTATIVNSGGSSTDTYTYVGIYLSTDPVITTDDTLLTNQYIGGLGAGAQQNISRNAMIPASLAAGTYYLGVIADYTGLQDESNEVNNTLAGTSINVVQ